MAQTPESIKPHASDYKDRAWEGYTFAELGQFVHLLVKRATHRANSDGKAKDLLDASNYLDMMKAKLEELR